VEPAAFGDILEFLLLVEVDCETTQFEERTQLVINNQ